MKKILVILTTVLLAACTKDAETELSTPLSGYLNEAVSLQATLTMGADGLDIDSNYVYFIPLVN